MTQKNKY
ncbi:unnamed protein product [Callosobruchus maculatus]|nr:unnamed protein product [Callosobruchus maculatus]